MFRKFLVAVVLVSALCLPLMARPKPTPAPYIKLVVFDQANLELTVFWSEPVSQDGGFDDIVVTNSRGATFCNVGTSPPNGAAQTYAMQACTEIPGTSGTIRINVDFVESVSTSEPSAATVDAPYTGI